MTTYDNPCLDYFESNLICHKISYLNIEDNFSLIFAKLVFGHTSVFARVGWMQISHSQCVIFNARPLVTGSFFDHVGL